ncbi:recombinase family protein [Caballeronia zhejiangensis]|uniref:recombinase family protein n=1 Tax=Caballeronia zhejiangensis TaxID=871203 RepID=UPI0015893B03|nr:recombinase family protein [Caballeronia zhejiangensis]MCG7403054.1 recombinase family protein [Caballeronia zhejiangensis]MCI1043879.1 recombinase family protein [Caballeronia zhejiangensis]
MAKRKNVEAPAAIEQPAGPPRLFIYGRFSSKKQASGNSYERQIKFAHAWASDHGYEIDDKKTMFDYATSAFRGKHRTAGALAAFFKAMKAGDVRPGDVLLVESLDRLSREEEFKAFDQFSQIVQAGVTIMSMQDGEFSITKVRETHGGILHQALGVMTRAHNESLSKSDRVQKAAHAICRAWRDDDWGKKKHRKPIPIGKDPSWVRWNEATESFDAIPAQVDAIRALIGFFRLGYSPMRCFDKMRAAGIALPDGISDHSRVHRVLQDRALVGEKFIQFDLAKKRPDIVETEYTIPGYYPAILSEDEFSALQHIRAQRGRRAGKAEVVSIMTGMRLTKCAKCGQSMAIQNVLTRVRREDGLPHDGHRRLKCIGARSAKNRCTETSCSVVPVERALMEFCSDQMNLAALFTDSDERAKLLATEHVRARRLAEEARAALDTFMQVGALASGDSAAIIATRIAQLTNEHREWSEKAARFEHDLATMNRHSTPEVAHEWAKLRDGVARLDNEARTKARQLVADTFVRIEIGLAHADLIELRLVSKRDVVRVLTIDRKTGERRDQMTVENTRHAALARRTKKQKLVKAA